jgi:hypothetical protein
MVMDPPSLSVSEGVGLPPPLGVFSPPPQAEATSPRAKTSANKLNHLERIDIPPWVWAIDPKE